VFSAYGPKLTYK